METLNENEVFDKVVEEFKKRFTESQRKEIDFIFKRKDKNDRDIYMTSLSKDNFGIFTSLIQTSSIILKVKNFEDSNKMKKINFDFTFEIFTINGIRLSFPFLFFVYDFFTKSLKEFKH